MVGKAFASAAEARRVEAVVTAVIAEDESLLRMEIKRTLGALWPELEIVAEAVDGIEAIRVIERFSPDIAFLDIMLPGPDGLAVAQHIGGKSHVVFITAYDQHALTAFEHGVLDYVLKPISLARMKTTVDRLKDRLARPPSDLRGLEELIKNVRNADKQYLKWLTLPCGSELRVVTTADICYLKADDKYTSVVTSERAYLLNLSLKKCKERLNPEMFWQVNRGIIVNVSAIDTIHRSFRGTLEIRIKECSEILPVSAAYTHLFRQF
jgi:DNA-binding LytR/AlgR family response regulator